MEKGYLEEGVVLAEFIEMGLIHDTNFYFTSDTLLKKKIKQNPCQLRTNIFEYKKTIFSYSDTMKLLQGESMSQSNNPIHDRISTILQDLTFYLHPSN